jgi:IclR family pca regulon transcriptional regulator
MAGVTNYRVEALARGLRVLSLFGEDRPRMTMTEIAEVSGIPLPSTFRIVATLTAEGYLEQRRDGAYQPGVAVLNLGFAALRGSDFLEVADGVLRRLAAETDATANLGSLQGARVLYLARVRDGSSLVTANLQVGSMLPAIHASMGKVLLAALGSGGLADLKGQLDFRAPAGPNAIGTLKDLREELKRVREAGYATQDEEVAAGLRSVAVPVGPLQDGLRYAINVAVPASRCSVQELAELALPPLRAAAGQLAMHL